MRRLIALSFIYVACGGPTGTPENPTLPAKTSVTDITTPDMTPTEDPPPPQSEDPPPPTSTLPKSTAPTKIVVTIDSAQNRRTISPYIYGVNQLRDGVAAAFVRAGGNRWTAYNWEHNASNAGTDYNNASDSYLSASTTPGDAVKTRVDAAYARNAAALVTVPMIDWVTADRSGNQAQAAGPGNSHFKKNVATKPGGPGAPNAGDDTVYQDEFVTWAQQTYATKQLFYSLDNEPALWPDTHPLVHGAAPTYAEMKTRSVTFAKMIRERAPNALIFGAVAYGFNEYENLQQASDANGRHYLQFYLDELKKAAGAGPRLLDVLDLHWYTEVKVNGAKVMDNYAAAPSDAIVDARLQSVRSLWDPTYTEASWIASYYSAPIRLIPRLQELIASTYPGTRLAFTEYNYGGGNHISGGLTEVDVLGVFGREGVFAANFWELKTDAASNAFIYAAFNLYRDYDGKKSQVGEVSCKAVSADNTKLSVFAFASEASKKIWIVAVNKTKTPVALDLSLTHDTELTRAQIVQLTSAEAKPKELGTYAPGGKAFVIDAPALSAVLIALAP